VVSHNRGRRLVQLRPVAVVRKDRQRAGREPDCQLVAGLVVALAVVEQGGQSSRAAREAIVGL